MITESYKRILRECSCQPAPDLPAPVRNAESTLDDWPFQTSELLTPLYQLIY